MSGPYRVALSKRAERSLQRLSREDRARVARVIDQIRDEPRMPGSAPVVTRPGLLRVRCGNQRILYQIDDAAREVAILELMPRGDDYRER